MQNAKDSSYRYRNYMCHKVFHKGEGRYYAVLVARGHRTTTSYARHMLSMHLGVDLRPEDTVDHIDGNKLNDSIENLQILSRKSNAVKYAQNDKHGPPAMLTFVCPVCGVSFHRSRSRSHKFIVSGAIPCCSRVCGGRHSHRK